LSKDSCFFQQLGLIIKQREEKKSCFFQGNTRFFSFKLGRIAVLLREEQQHMALHCCCFTDFNPMLWQETTG
jgi:hypothetical protein